MIHDLLFRYTDRLYRAHSVEEVYDAALDAICEGLVTPRASILRFNDAGFMRFVASRGLSDHYCTLVEGHSPWKPGARNAEMICVEDIASSDESDGVKKAVLEERIRGLAFIPLTIDEEVVGKFMVYYDTARLFTEQERELATIIARQLGFAIERNLSDSLARRLAAIVDSSEDAIISKDLDGIITSWNGAAEQLFGYKAHEAIGRSVTMLIPDDRDEEPRILAQIRAGERIRSFETVRRRKNGDLVDISLTVSPVRNAEGAVIGASKIARDIGDKKRAREQQTLLLREMNHRVKNLFALASSIIQLNARTATSVKDLASTVADRLSALARAHSLTVTPEADEHAAVHPSSPLQNVIAAIVAPYNSDAADEAPRISITGDDMEIASETVTPLALLLYELATNAAKYGALSVPTGRIDVDVAVEDGKAIISWRESGGPRIEAAIEKGFGSRIVEATASQLGEIKRDWNVDGLEARILLKRPRSAG